MHICIINIWSAFGKAHCVKSFFFSIYQLLKLQMEKPMHNVASESIVILKTTTFIWWLTMEWKNWDCKVQTFKRYLFDCFFFVFVFYWRKKVKLSLKLFSFSWWLCFFFVFDSVCGSKPFKTKCMTTKEFEFVIIFASCVHHCTSGMCVCEYMSGTWWEHCIDISVTVSIEQSL